MKTARIGVFGVGSWAASNHLPVLLKRSDVELVVAVDSSQQRRASIAEAFPQFSAVASTVDEALAMNLDGVIVGAGPSAHVALVRPALEAGCHVLCEKPFTSAGVDAWELVELARSRNVSLLTSYGWNYFRMTQEAKRLLDEHQIGDIEFVQGHIGLAVREAMRGVQSGAEFGATWNRPPGFYPSDDAYTSLAKGAGIVQGTVTHLLGLLLYLTDLRADSVYAALSTADAPVDLHDALSIRFRNGSVGSISGTVTPTGSNNNKLQLDLRIFGSNGQLILDYERERVWLYADGADIDLPVTPGEGDYSCDGPPNALVDLCLGRATLVASDAEIAARATEITEAALVSWHSGVAESTPISPARRSEFDLRQPPKGCT